VNVADSDGDSETDVEGLGDAVSDMLSESEALAEPVAERVPERVEETERDTDSLSVGGSDGVGSLKLPETESEELSVIVEDSLGDWDPEVETVWASDSDSDTSTVVDGGCVCVVESSCGDTVPDAVGSGDGEAVSVPDSVALMDSEPEPDKVNVWRLKVIGSDALSLTEAALPDLLGVARLRVRVSDFETEAASEGVSLPVRSLLVPVVDWVSTAESVTLAVSVGCSDTVCDTVSLRDADGGIVWVTVGEVSVALWVLDRVWRERVEEADGDDDAVRDVVRDMVSDGESSEVLTVSLTSRVRDTVTGRDGVTLWLTVPVDDELADTKASVSVSVPETVLDRAAVSVTGSVSVRLPLVDSVSVTVPESEPLTSSVTVVDPLRRLWLSLLEAVCSSDGDSVRDASDGDSDSVAFRD
jgi:hypothetical protein